MRAKFRRFYRKFGVAKQEYDDMGMGNQNMGLDFAKESPVT